jgi:hypothetical protein
MMDLPRLSKPFLQADLARMIARHVEAPKTAKAPSKSKAASTV